jgi:signal transduction histidine kinase
MALALRDDKGYNDQEIVIERADGSYRTVLANANPFHDQKGQVCGAVNVLVDITERKQMENLLREAGRRKSEFLATLAHELRNPLAPLRNALQIMRLAGHDQKAIEQARTVMDRQIRHMVRLLDDLLDLSRITNGKMELHREPIDVAAAVQDAVETSRPIIEASGHRFGVDLPSQPVHVNADRTRLAQVFANLLNNSAKYTPRGGQIRLIVERQGGDVLVTIKDNGIGIPTDMLPKVFDMFTQVDRSLERAQGGLGIGLSLVRALVQMHGGQVEAASDGPGKGSAFSVRLSVLLPPVGGSRERGGEDGGLFGCSKCRILVVDDNEDSALSLSTMLRIMGHQTQTATDGLQAVAAADACRPDVVLLDIGLPKLNGYEVCRRLRAQPWGRGIVIIAMTGWGQEEDRVRSKEAGFNIHMVKPVDPAALLKLLADPLLTPA